MPLLPSLRLLLMLKFYFPLSFFHFLNTGTFLIPQKHSYLGVILVISGVYQCVWFYFFNNIWPNTHQCIDPFHEGKYPSMVKPSHAFSVYMRFCGFVFNYAYDKINCDSLQLGNYQFRSKGFLPISFIVFTKLYPAYVSKTYRQKNSCNNIYPVQIFKI